jgi:hypothetical protein
MREKWISIGVLVAIAAALLNTSSCARSQRLVSISVIPGSGTFASVDPQLFFIYNAYGTYIHPPKTIDITGQVTWQTDNPQVAQFTAPGVISPNLNCGVAQIYATMHNSANDVVSNQVSITVDGPVSEGCPQGTVTFNLSVSLTGATNGVVVSSPAGINCGSGGNTCSAPFAANSTVALTATPNTGHTFGGWGTGCSTVSGTTCSVLLNTNIAVSASFN